LKNLRSIAAIGAVLLTTGPGMTQDAISDGAAKLVELWNPANWCELSPVCDPASAAASETTLVGASASSDLSNALQRWEDCTKAAFSDGALPDECKSPFLLAISK